MNKTKTQDYLSVAEFARQIKVSPITVRRWDKERVYGKPKPKKTTTSGHRLYTFDQVTTYFKKTAAAKVEKTKTVATKTAKKTKATKKKTSSASRS